MRRFAPAFNAAASLGGRTMPYFGGIFMNIVMTAARLLLHTYE